MLSCLVISSNYKAKYVACEKPQTVEATMSAYNRRTGVKQLRVRGLKAVTFAAVLKALGLTSSGQLRIKKKRSGGIKPFEPEGCAIFHVIDYVKEQIVLLVSFNNTTGLH
jgi:hypothetical protein